MSYPISVCMVCRALTEDVVLKDLETRLKYNIKFGSVLIYNCECGPKHEPLTDAEFETLKVRLEALQ